MHRVAVKYCGSCNPQVDLSRLGAELAGMATELGAAIVPLEQGDIDLVVILCGCPRACGNKSEVKARARRFVLVAGHCLDGKPVSEEKLVLSLRQHCLTFIDAAKDT